MPKRICSPPLKLAGPLPLDLMNQTTDCCCKIAALAQLLASCQTKRLRSETVSVAGALLGDETAKLRQALSLLCHQRPQPPAQERKMTAMEEQIARANIDAGAKPRILVIDDEPAFSGVLLLILKSGGFDVCIASTGADGLQLAEEQNYDLILSDIDLPDISGFEICRRVKQNPKLRSVPIILMSGWLAEENEARALKLGAVDYLSKPFPATIVLSRVSAHVRRAKNAP